VAYLDIEIGRMLQVAVDPTLYTTSPEAIQRFSPEERGCYDQQEVMMKHLPYGMYRWVLGNPVLQY
jgi:hypothetical protein